MKVNTTHPDYDEYIEQWEKCEIVREGEEEVKKVGTRFLPRLDKQNDNQYKSYKMRALFYNAVERTVQGLTGAVFAKQPIFHLDNDENPDFFNSLSLDGIPFIDLAKNTFTEVLCPSRVGLFADVPDNEDGGDAYIVKYEAEDIINWFTGIINGKLQATKIVLHEDVWEEGDDEFEHTEIEQWRVLDLIPQEKGGHIYRQRLFRKDERPEAKNKFFQFGDDIIPTRRGVPLDSIPFVIINPTKIGTEVEKPICIDMVNVNLSHYRSSADLEHGRHFTGLPTAWVSGFDPKQTQLTIGSTVAWVSINPHAKAGFLEFTGQGLKALENALQEKERLLTILGARILEGQKDAVENAETQKVRRLGENSILANIADTVSVGLTHIVQIVADWRGRGKVRIELNKEYTAISADAQIVTAMMAALQQGAISFDTWFFNLKKWQMLPTERTIDDELNLIEARQSVLSLAPQVTQTPGNQQRPTTLLDNAINNDPSGDNQNTETE
jgi:hypothetical protein